MADYRAISQDYAQGAIKATIVVNGGAAVALLTQISELPRSISGAVLVAMACWTVGIVLGVLCWVLAFASSRYVDKSEVESSPVHLLTSDRFMTWGIIALLLSLALFLVGALYFALGFHAASAAVAP